MPSRRPTGHKRAGNQKSSKRHKVSSCIKKVCKERHRRAWITPEPILSLETAQDHARQALAVLNATVFATDFVLEIFSGAGRVQLVVYDQQEYLVARLNAGFKAHPILEAAHFTRRQRQGLLTNAMLEVLQIESFHVQQNWQGRALGSLLLVYALAYVLVETPDLTYAVLTDCSAKSRSLHNIYASVGFDTQLLTALRFVDASCDGGQADADQADGDGNQADGDGNQADGDQADGDQADGGDQKTVDDACVGVELVQGLKINLTTKERFFSERGEHYRQLALHPWASTTLPTLLPTLLATYANRKATLGVPPPEK